MSKDQPKRPWQSKRNRLAAKERLEARGDRDSRLLHQVRARHISEARPSDAQLIADTPLALPLLSCAEIRTTLTRELRRCTCSSSKRPSVERASCARSARPTQRSTQRPTQRPTHRPTQRPTQRPTPSSRPTSASSRTASRRSSSSSPRTRSRSRCASWASHTRAATLTQPRWLARPRPSRTRSGYSLIAASLRCSTRSTTR